MSRLVAAVLAAVLVLTGCAGTSDRAGVVVTTNILGDVTRAVVGDQAEVTVLMQAGADPHSFGLSAQEAALMEDAALLVHNGLGLEEGVARNVETATHAGVPTIAAGEAAGPMTYVAGDAAGQPDPHFWTDPARMRRAVEAITERVVADVPGVDAGVVRANADGYLAELDALDTWMTQRFAELPAERRKLVTNHHVFGYFAARYGFEVVGAVVPSGTTLASPSPSDLASLAGAIRDAGVNAIFADSSQPGRLARVLAEQAGVQVRVIPLFSESLTAPGGGAATYLDLMRSNTDAIVSGLTENR
ncbi:zinc ABC transporter substrate-binding protein AztC [Amycolatopsis endophytica]|uniref:Zinc/manganese transport system substrate-binding protein n=1 Tax=Amycolatopsis endophytica TaxID=860233 RepID=A0A853BD37_9PSEU|nr:zinc ABC transporter substrate-binding protein AztC [Amycolatopsis endophytica]NYI93283.1 zinc/manganese transport system substrate-binding protein [Amycolatopsis endophytica]